MKKYVETTLDDDKYVQNVINSELSRSTCFVLFVFFFNSTALTASSHGYISCTFFLPLAL